MKSKINIIESDDAVSEVLGYSLILGIVIISVGLMTVSSFPILSDLKDSVFMETSLESLSMLDGKISMVAYGTTTSQPSRFDLNGGKMTVGNDTGSRVTITVYNSSGELSKDIIYLGKLEYIVGDQKIGFENGGIFRKYPEGNTVMISPPEFHFNGGTLTFPIIKINGNDSISGKGVITINAISNDSISNKNPVTIYPKGNNSSNPIFDKGVNITIKSEYYKSWAQYIEERTEVDPSTNDSTQEVSVSINPNLSNISYIHIVEHEVNIVFQ
jgi:hypothetical protein